MFAQRFLGSPRGRHYNLLERNVRRKVVSTQKKNNFGERHRFFAAVLSGMGVGNSDTRVAQGFVRTTLKYSVKSSDKLFSMRMGYGEINIA